MEEKKIYVLFNDDDYYESALLLTEKEAKTLEWFFNNFESDRHLTCIENPIEIS